MEAAGDHGFKDGYVFPFHFVDMQGRIYSTVNGLFWRDERAKMNFLLKSEKRLELNLILLYWNERAIELIANSNGRVGMFADLPNNGDNSKYLTDREREILMWAGRGLTVSDTADILKISEETVQTHVRNAVQKLGATNKTHAVAKALHLGMIDL
jgi:DNA-binding CsgD family transcriptional regulator